MKIRENEKNERIDWDILDLMYVVFGSTLHWE
jgi:hypothetical protein